MENESARVAAAVPRRRGPASTENGQRSRDRVLQAALDLITEAGIDQVRVAEIARRAGMSSGQVMYYFTSKEHILLETLVWQDGQDIERTRAALREVSQLLEEQLRLWRDELAAIVDRGVREGAFTPPAALDDFTLRFTALLDGLAILRLRRMHQPSRKRLIDLAMATARAELAGAA